MSRLNYDCLEILFDKFLELQDEDDGLDGYGLLYTCAFLNRDCKTIANHLLYKDPWKYWLYRSKNKSIAKQLIDTYMLCYKYNAIKNRNRVNRPSNEEEGEEDPSKRVAKEEHVMNGVDDDDHKLPLDNYISYAKNLHVPSLYQCIKIWYEYQQAGKESSQMDCEEEENIQPVYNLFLEIFELFVQEARIRDCTFAESTEDDDYPVTLEQLGRLINHGVKVDLKYLNLGFFPCDSQGLSRITEKCNRLKTFKISAQNCSDEVLAKFIESQTRLTKLKIRNAQKIDLTLKALGTQSKSLVKLRVLNSNLESCQKPFDGIASCANLRSIYMRKTSWPTDVSPSTLLMPIAINCEFHNVDFSGSELPADVLVEIAKKSSTTLRKVHLERPENQIDHESYDLSDGIRALAKHCKNIIHFERDILPREISSMIYFLNEVGNSLVRLEIESKLMSFSNIDASDLIISISNCSNLETLNISYFNFTPQVFEKLIIGCKSLTTLLICNSTSVNDQILHIIREKSKNLKNLDILACSNITDEAVEQLQSETEIEVDLDLIFIQTVVRISSLILF
ncbi:hypothetical protein C1645_803711 [Glomus cerebriforme]|uniref:F-box domain-containing protein n=1 Tax=Glomus cerebriforme TaxID=658196 RepID=A0A397T6V2_9GLOM|nr:hypothetical protein C1645_803711 [Glomus cerebriforme]